MWAYFKSWRRRIGVLTLAMALMLTGIWVSSSAGMVGIIVRGVSLCARDGVLQFWLPDPARYTSVEVFSVPCWLIVVPLTLLSAWLLFSNSKQSKPTPEKSV